MNEHQVNTNKFKELSYEKKVEMDKNILLALSKKGNIEAGEILSTINDMDHIADNILNSIYLDFEKSVDRIKQGKVDSQLHTFDKIKKYTKSLHKQEDVERAIETPDDLLNNL